MFSLYGLDQRLWKRWRSIAGECQRHLTDQQIAVGNPGTILTDVSTLLGFVGPDGIVTKNKNANLPPDQLPELNRRVSHPIELNLKRALLRDYPNLAGIFILLRVMDLIQFKGSRLAIHPAALEFWLGLNATEQYFALFEALLFHAQSSVLGATRRHEETRTFEATLSFLGQLSSGWRDFDNYESAHLFGQQGKLPTWHLFVQQQLGLIEIRPLQMSEKENRSWGGSGWLVGSARLTPWGSAAAWALLEFQKQDDDAESGAGMDNAPSADLFQSLFEEAEPEDMSEESDAEAPFGILRPIFQPYFPEWIKDYARPQREVGTGTHIFKVTIAGWRSGDSGIWRRIAMPPDASLDMLAGAILDAFKFDSDHLYDFRYRDQRGRSRVYNHPATDEGPFTSEITVGGADLALKDVMRFTFDYGDNWQFDARLEKVEAEPCRLKRPKVIESAGKAPKQYAEW